MISLTEFINESIINEATKGTLKDYVLWHYNLDDEKDFTFDKFSESDFDAKALKKYFGGDKQAMYDEIVNLMKNDKKIGIDSKYAGNDVLTKFKAGKFTFNALSNNNSKWHTAREINTDIMRLCSDDTKLGYDNQLLFKEYALYMMDKENILDKVLAKYDLTRRSFKYRCYGLFSFDHVTAYDSLNDSQTPIKDVKSDGSMTFGEAYKALVNYFK